MFFTSRPRLLWSVITNSTETQNALGVLCVCLHVGMFICLFAHVCLLDLFWWVQLACIHIQQRAFSTSTFTKLENGPSTRRPDEYVWECHCAAITVCSVAIRWTWKYSTAWDWHHYQSRERKWHAADEMILVCVYIHNNLHNRHLLAKATYTAVWDLEH